MAGNRISGRRRFLGTVGAAAVTGLAGCAGGGGSGDTSGGSSGDGTVEGDTSDGSTSPTTDTGAGSGSGSGSADASIGVLLPFTGEYDWVGGNVLPVVEMLVDALNSSGGIDGTQVRVVQADTEATVDASVSAAQKLINVDSVDLIVGPTSLTFTGVIDLIRENGVPVVTPTAGTTALDSVGGEYIFRTVPSDSLGGRAISRAARNQEFNTAASYENMGLMVGNAPALQSFKEPISSSFEEYGGTLTSVLDYATGKSSYQSEVSKMLSSDPELVTLVGTPEDSAKILRAAFQAGYEGNWFVTQDQTNADFLELTDDRVTEGILGLVEADSPAAVEVGRVEQFAADFQSYAGREPGIFAKNTFDAVNIGALAMKAALAADGELTRDGIAAQIRPVATPGGETVTNYAEGAAALDAGSEVNYEGLVGPCDFDENGDIASPFAVMKASDGAWEQVATLPADEL
ncbi:ABC transporter substrate-binding protein [Salinigranum halophilum]|uniref:ABC transporter substrate-binding protein n=1 Tax=Salinigranum halophilum TaxID=2565931 RepID=UPI0022A6D99D|nr:ABC transporter substrate-binding protein [Salinigranum halophilum]